MVTAFRPLRKAAAKNRGLRLPRFEKGLKRALILLICVSSFISFGNCGEPLAPLTASWFGEIALPRFGITAITVKEEGLSPGVYLVGNTPGHDAEGFYRSYILKYDGYKLTTEFAIQYTEPQAVVIKDIAFYRDSGWAVGGESNGETGFEPFLIYFDGGVWKERIIENEVGAIKAIYPINDHSFWIIGDKESVFSTYGRLIKYESGVFKYFDGIGRVDFGCYSAETGYFYCPRRDGFSGTSHFNVTADGGNTWFSEILPGEYFGYSLEDIRDLTAAGDALFMTCDFAGSFSGAIKRRGAPGSGEYSLSFLSNKSGDFGGIKAAAFEKGGRGLAVGNDASVLYDGAAWAVEELPYPFAFAGIAPTREGGFWAFGENTGAMGRWELLYHP
jgi:hypothetical protein